MNIRHRVEFERPNLPDLTKAYTVVDMHFHSRYSDGFNRVSNIVNRARKLGIGIAITDHNEIIGAVKIAKLYRDILTVPGIEITSVEGTHLLVYFYEVDALIQFYDNDLRPFLGKDVMNSTQLTMADIIERARQYETLIIFPHPYSAIYTGVCNIVFSKEDQAALFDMSDGVEVINAGNLSKWNLKCAVLGFNLGKSMVGGSDGHNLFQMGRAVTFTDKVANCREFLNTVKESRNYVIGKEINLFRKVTTNSAKIRSNIKNYPHLVGKNVRFGYTALNSKSRKVKNSMRRSLKGRLVKH